MKLRIFPVVGEALNFGGRRLETIARVAWLPVTLILIVNMATVFAYLSVIAGRMITFADVPTYFAANQILTQYAAQGWVNNATAMQAITAVNVVLQTILIASFMAPLIRFAGLGEKPGPGVIRLAFGPDQIRYILAGVFSFFLVAILVLAPMATATFFIIKYIFEAMSQTMAIFPDPNSLHTIELVTAAESLKSQGSEWLLNFAIPLAAAAPFALVLWFVTFNHFNPRNRPAAPEKGSPIQRAFVTLVAAAMIAFAAYFFFRQEIQTYFLNASSANDLGKTIFSDTTANAQLWLGAVIFALVGYANLRLYPYPGLAVCRKSMGFGKMMRVSRGWNIISLQAILVLAGILLILVQYSINNFIIGWLASAINIIYQAIASSTRLLNSGVTAEWVLPVFIWIWNGIKIFINIIVTFFTYGVLAGLYGRLYRESEREEVIERRSSAKAIWQRA